MLFRTRIFQSVGAAAIAVLASACSHNSNVAKNPNDMVVTSSSNRTQPVSTSHLDVSSDLARACNLHFDNVDQAPKFDFDRALLTSDDQSVLTQVATCVETGPMKGRSLKLIGRADPRGEVEYNFVLGASRASSVKSFLANHGVDASKVATSSRGKLDATGTDEASWQRDRRVDVDLGGS